MAKKRKSAATPLDEVDRTLYSSFCGAANSLSHLYSQAMSHQRFSFQAGERHALDKLYQWILRQQESGSRVTTVDIVSYLQHELDYGADEHPQTATNLGHSPVTPVPSNPFPPAVKNPVFSNALSSPVRRSLQNYHLTPRSNENSYPPQHQHQGSRETNSNDSAMDMHADSPGQDSIY
ncbi:uncharacterized protein LOC116209503 [Punica granatum]|uniref:Holocarboxylase synthetase n=2 Tax=Punica granatum TaxID=22663 RepID=A0A218XC32_PUNGR|nr:uncharacterized protein LOC116209503 [Punica granatum]OWM82280.1 hypothetical protein CDL15_Pgr001854 [Punica granatum]PKI62041.1 hypothetical protein CRG98_017414 [Punica granatum]